MVGADNKVQLRRVEVGASVQGLRIITSGLTEGERIVVEGVQKISDGAVVDPKPVPPAAPVSAPAAESNRAATAGSTSVGSAASKN